MRPIWIPKLDDPFHGRPARPKRGGLRAGWRAAFGGLKQLARAMAGRLDWPDFLGSERGWSAGFTQRRAEIERPMEVNAAVYSGVRAIAQTLAGFPAVLYRGERSARVERGAAWELLQAPRADLTAARFQEEWAGHLIEGGEAHILLERGIASGRVRGLQVIGRREMFAVRTAEGTLAAWELRRGRQRRLLAPEDDAYARLFHPYDQVRGLSPLAAAALGIQQDYAAAVYNANALENGSLPGGIFVFPEGVSEQQAREYGRLIQSQFQGPERSNLPLVAGGGLDYKATAWRNTDLELFTGRKFARDEIFNALGVPSVIVAIFEAAHYDVADKSIEIFLLHTIAPLVASYEAVMNRLVLPAVEPGVQVYLDMTAHPVLQRTNWAKIEALAKALATGIPYNEAAGLVGLSLGEQEWGEISLLPATLARAEEVAAGLAAPPEEAPETAPQAERDRSSEARSQISNLKSELPAFAALAAGELRIQERQVRVQMPRIRQRFRAFFLGQERRLSARLRKVLGGGAAALGAVWPWEHKAADEAERTAARILLRISDEQGKLRALARDYFPLAIEETLRAELKRLGWESEKIAAAVERVMRGRFIRGIVREKELRITDVERVTRERVRRQLVSGLREGETVQQLADRIHGVLGGARARALTIARTEAGQAVSTARFVAAGAAGAKGKAWITGNNPRATHIQAGLDYAPAGGAIPMEEAFEVGADRLMYPCDPAGSAGEIINCNCAMVSVRLKGEERQMVNISGAGARAA